VKKDEESVAAFNKTSLKTPKNNICVNNKIHQLKPNFFDETRLGLFTRNGK
jgi:hypothetical protein